MIMIKFLKGYIYRIAQYSMMIDKNKISNYSNTISHFLLTFFFAYMCLFSGYFFGSTWTLNSYTIFFLMFHVIIYTYS